MEIMKEILESIVAVIAVSLLVVTGLVIAMLFELLLALGAFLWIPCLILGALGWLYVKTGAVLSKGKSSTSMSESEMPALTESVKDLDIKM